MNVLFASTPGWYRPSAGRPARTQQRGRRGTDMSQLSRIERRRIERRTVIKAGAAAGLAAVGLLPRVAHTQARTQTVNMQLGWLAGNNQAGEVAAKYLGYFEEEKINLVIQPGGPTIDGVAIVASGRYELGQVSSSPSL